MSRELTQLKSQVERVTYYNEENDYAVIKVKVYGRMELVTVIGNIASPTPEEVLAMSGEWIKHPQFGEQFKVTFCKSCVGKLIFLLINT